MRTFIQPIGTHCTGKSRVISSIALSYDIYLRRQLWNRTNPENTCLVLGSYSKKRSGIYTGGFDAYSVTTDERHKLIRELWQSDYEIAMTEGFMIVYYNTFVNCYKELEPKRKVILLYLDTPLELIKERLVIRSKGKEWTKKREGHVVGKLQVCKKTLELVKDDDFFVVKKFKNETEEDLLEILKYVEAETGVKMKQYKTKDDITDLSRWMQ